MENVLNANKYKDDPPEGAACLVPGRGGVGPILFRFGPGGVGGVACLLGGPDPGNGGPGGASCWVLEPVPRCGGPWGAPCLVLELVPAPEAPGSVACLVPAWGGPVESRNVLEMFGNANKYKDDPPEGAASLAPELGPRRDGSVPVCVALCLAPDAVCVHGGPVGAVCLVLEVVVWGRGGSCLAWMRAERRIFSPGVTSASMNLKQLIGLGRNLLVFIAEENS